MLQITRQTEYAIRGLRHLTRLNGEAPVQLRVLATECDVSEAFLAKIFQILGQAGLVRSHRGVKGGFSLGRPADQISLLQIVEVTEGGISLNLCTRGDGSCPDEDNCSVAPVWARAQDALSTSLRDTSLADVS